MNQASSYGSSSVCFFGIEELGKKYRTRELSPVEVTEMVLSRIDTYDKDMRAYITVTADLALDQAKQAEQEFQDGIDRGPLHGVTFSLKDNIATKGIRTSCASTVDPYWIPETDATVYTQLRKAGAILVGKANLLEYAFSMNPAFPPPLNPWRADRTSSGSSSGSAVGVAIGMAHMSIGTDTGGSGRVPASINGVVGLKPTYDRISRIGVVPLSYSLDHTTTITRGVNCSRLLLGAVAEAVPTDSSWFTNLSEPLSRSITGLRIGIARGYTYEDVDSDVVLVMDAAKKIFHDLGASLSEIQLPAVEHYVSAHNAIMHSEAATVHYHAHRNNPDKFGSTALERLDLGAVIPATDYIRAQQARKYLSSEFQNLFDEVDILLSPITPMRPGPAESWSSTTEQGVEIDRRVSGPEYTGIYNLTGLPAISLPAGFSSEGTPIGIQLAGRWFDEATLLQAAYMYEQATDWHKYIPPLPVSIE